MTGFCIRFFILFPLQLYPHIQAKMTTTMKSLYVDAAHIGKQPRQLKCASQIIRLLVDCEIWCDYALNGMRNLAYVAQPDADVFDCFGITRF